jgi:hypothetical protein
MTDENGRMSGEGRVVRNVAAISGLSISAMSVVLGLSILGTNERHLHNSVQLYNETNPGHPIELQITASTPLW